VKNTALLCTLLLLSMAFIPTAGAGENAKDGQRHERGRYLTVISGCHDCHTPGYAEAAGKVPAEHWFTGSVVGFKGPWGTSYPANLRLKVQDMTEAQWLARTRQPMLPPMPWFNLRDMKDADLVAMYRYLRALGPAGKPAPATAAPEQAVNTPYIDFVPRNLPKQAQAGH